MRKTLLTLVALVAGLLVVSRPVAAHHGAAAFENDPAKRLVLKGVVTQWIWANPHTFLQFDVKGDDGQVVHWVVEASNPPDMQNRGWTNKSFKAGDEVTVTVRPVKSGRPVGSIIQVQFADGHVLSAVSWKPSRPSGAVTNHQARRARERGHEAAFRGVDVCFRCGRSNRGVSRDAARRVGSGSR